MSTRTAIRALLTTHIGGAIVKSSSLVAHRSPLRIARCGAHESSATGHGSSLLSTHSLVAHSRDDTSANHAIAPDLPSDPRSRCEIRPFDARARPQHERRARPRSSVVNRHAGTDTRLSRVDASGAALSAAHHSRTSTRNRHRRSTWAGVSWRNDDDIGARGGENIGRTRARTGTTRSTRGVTSLCAPSSEHLPVRRRASCSRRK